VGKIHHLSIFSNTNLVQCSPRACEKPFELYLPPAGNNVDYKHQFARLNAKKIFAPLKIQPAFPLCIAATDGWLWQPNPAHLVEPNPFDLQRTLNLRLIV